MAQKHDIYCNKVNFCSLKSNIFKFLKKKTTTCHNLVSYGNSKFSEP